MSPAETRRNCRSECRSIATETRLTLFKNPITPRARIRSRAFICRKPCRPQAQGRTAEAQGRSLGLRSTIPSSPASRPPSCADDASRESVCSQARADRSTACTIHLPGLPIFQRSVKNQSSPRLFQGSVVRGQAIFAAVQCLADRQAPTLCLRRKNREKAVLVKPRELFVADVVEEQDAFDIVGLLPKLLQVCGLGQAAGENKCRRFDETRCGRLPDVE